MSETRAFKIKISGNCGQCRRLLSCRDLENKTDDIEEDLQLMRTNDRSSNKEEVNEEDNSVQETIMSNTPTTKNEEDPILLTAVTQSTFV